MSSTQASTKSVSFDVPRNSTSSLPADVKASTLTTYGKKHQVSKICQPTGAWYDCLRPTTKPYQGFGNLSDFSEMSANDTRAGTEESWTHEIRHSKITPYMQRRISS